MSKMNNLPDDQEYRERILRELDRNLLVEAAAGTGKTTIMVSRMIELLATGRCGDIRTIAAVTFTRKAAAELRSRFRAGLEQAAGKHTGAAKEALETALSMIDQCFTGTIHSLCARLIRERPIEAGVDPSFEEMDEEMQKRLKKEAFDSYSARIWIQDDDGVLKELQKTGLEIADLYNAFSRFTDYADVDEWPAEAGSIEDIDTRRALRALEEYVGRIRVLEPHFPANTGNDKLIPLMSKISRMMNSLDDPGRPDRLFTILREFESSHGIVQKVWKSTEIFSGKDAKNELNVFEEFRDNVALPFLDRVRQCRYGIVLKVLKGAQKEYDALRRRERVLDFQDLLVIAARLLREDASVRRWFKSRITHLLVDEFHDTDPVQAEVMLLLTGKDAGERNWRRCVPAPGSLFVVGDPKQSIYRFRRADIVTYSEVKEIIRQSNQDEDDAVVRLWSNFRSARSVVSWVNEVFEPDDSDDDDPEIRRFPSSSNEFSPAWVAMESGRIDQTSGSLEGVYAMHVSEGMKKEQAIDYDAECIARFIRNAVDEGMTVARTLEETERGKGPGLEFSDFMIVTRNRTNLAAYGRRLQGLSIPYEITGGSSMNRISQLMLAYLCLDAVVHPLNPLCLLAVLRSGLFGASDAALYDFKSHGGVFNYTLKLPSGMMDETRLLFEDAFSRLRRYALWLDHLPMPAAVRNTVSDLGLIAAAAAQEGGDYSAGGLAKALEILRSESESILTTEDLVERIRLLAEDEASYDAVSAVQTGSNAVRIMNLHKVKGLQAPVVFLADPTGDRDADADLYVDRKSSRIRGFMRISKPAGHFQSRVVALPADWSRVEEIEKRFAGAENLRLRYVAATRAGSALIVTTGAAGRKTKNPWRYFGPFIADERIIEPAPETHAPGGMNLNLRPDHTSGILGKISRGMNGLRQKSYEAMPATEYARLYSPGAVSSEESMPAMVRYSEAAGVYPADGAHGTEWGSVIHAALHAAMQNPEADLNEYARQLLMEYDLSLDLVQKVVSTVQSVMRSTIWKKASESEKCFTEIPFQIYRPAKDTGVLPALIRGSIDLVFRDREGWTLVDYKTDTFAGTSAEKLARTYGPQLRVYADAWALCTGERIKKAALYLVHDDALVDIVIE